MSRIESIVRGPVTQIIEEGDLRRIEYRMEGPGCARDPQVADRLSSPLSMLWTLPPEAVNLAQGEGPIVLEFGPGAEVLTSRSSLDGIAVELLVSRAIRVAAEAVAFSPRDRCDPFLGCAAVRRGGDVLFAGLGVAQAIAPDAGAPNLIAALEEFLSPFEAASPFASAILADLSLLEPSSSSPEIDRDTLLLRHFAGARIPGRKKEEYLLRKAGYLIMRGREEEALPALASARLSSRYFPTRGKPFTGACNNEVGAYAFIVSLLSEGKNDEAAAFAIHFFKRDFFATATIARNVLSSLLSMQDEMGWSIVVDVLTAAATCLERLAQTRGGLEDREA